MNKELRIRELIILPRTHTMRRYLNFVTKLRAIEMLVETANKKKAARRFAVDHGRIRGFAKNSFKFNTAN